jgi:hypothetical protein
MLFRLAATYCGVIASVDSNTQVTLADAWPDVRGGAGLRGSSARLDRPSRPGRACLGRRRRRSTRRSAIVSWRAPATSSSPTGPIRGLRLCRRWRGRAQTYSFPLRNRHVLARRRGDRRGGGAARSSADAVHDRRAVHGSRTWRSRSPTSQAARRSASRRSTRAWSAWGGASIASYANAVIVAARTASTCSTASRRRRSCRAASRRSSSAMCGSGASRAGRRPTRATTAVPVLDGANTVVDARSAAWTVR